LCLCRRLLWPRNARSKQPLAMKQMCASKYERDPRGDLDETGCTPRTQGKRASGRLMQRSRKRGPRNVLDSGMLRRALLQSARLASTAIIVMIAMQ